MGTFAQIYQDFKNGRLVQCTTTDGKRRVVIHRYQWDPETKLAWNPDLGQWELFIPYEDLLFGDWVIL